MHRRRSIRLPGYDYSRPGAYFVTIVAQDRLCLFGEVVDGEMLLNEAGGMVEEAWEWLARRHPYVELDSYVVMPNHLHGVIVLTDAGGRGGSRTALTRSRSGGGSGSGGRGGSRTAPTGRRDQREHGVGAIGRDDYGSQTADTVSGSIGGGKGRKTLGRLVGAFKTVSTKRINIVRGTPGEMLWQRNYYERVIRNDRELNLIREYIEGNPAKWETDEENPDVVAKGNP